MFRATASKTPPPLDEMGDPPTTCEDVLRAWLLAAFVLVLVVLWFYFVIRDFARGRL